MIVSRHNFFFTRQRITLARCARVLSGEFGVDEGVEFVGEVGDVILWHNFLVRAQQPILCFLPIQNFSIMVRMSCAACVHVVHL